MSCLWLEVGVRLATEPTRMNKGHNTNKDPSVFSDNCSSLFGGYCVSRSWDAQWKSNSRNPLGRFAQYLWIMLIVYSSNWNWRWPLGTVRAALGRERGTAVREHLSQTHSAVIASPN